MCFNCSYQVQKYKECIDGAVPFLILPPGDAKSLKVCISVYSFFNNVYLLQELVLYECKTNVSFTTKGEKNRNTVPLGSKVCYAYCYMNWTFDFPCMEGDMCRV